jgi:hypothetical protein
MEAAIIKPKLPKRVKLRKAFSKLSLFNGSHSPAIHGEGSSKSYELKKMYLFVKNFLSLRCARGLIDPPPCTPARVRRRAVKN